MARDERVLNAQVLLLQRYFRLGMQPGRRTYDAHGEVRPPEWWWETAADATFGRWGEPGSLRRGGVRTEARFAPLVQLLVDTFDPHVVRYASRALAFLPEPDWARCILATLTGGLQYGEFVRAYTEMKNEQRRGLGLPPLGGEAITIRTAQRWRAWGLEAVAYALWADDGTRTVPGVQSAETPAEEGAR